MDRLTREELLQILRESKGGALGHQEAEDALLEYIDDEEITEAFRLIPDMWYE